MAGVKRSRNDSTSPSSLTHAGSGIDGDLPRIPKISRKIHACTECQARKIKCDLDPPHRQTCTRCSKKNLRCVINKSLQSLLEEGTEWRTRMEEQSETLSLAVSKILRVLELPALESFASQIQHDKQISEQVGDIIDKSTETTRPARTSGMAMTRENSHEPDINKTNDALVTDPMGSLYEVTKLRNLRSNTYEHLGFSRSASLEDDFISKGMLNETEAEELFRTFTTSLNQYLWGGVALVHEDLTAVRKSSSLLLAAVLTVTALHIPGKEKVFDVCYKEFTSLVCDSMFERYHSFDGVRALCIGAFWLSDVSWKLSGHAVRIATELNLHQNYSRAMRGSREHLEGARLWYLLYVCDHHFSIAYGRPPVIQEDPTITNHEEFLTLPGISQTDFRLHSQVSIFIILTRVYNTFGPNIEQIVSEEDLNRLRHFNVSLDGWRLKWESQLAPNPYVASYPAKGVILHHQFAKLQVNSLALRGIQQSAMVDLSRDRRELANFAMTCATSILQIVLDEPDIRNSVVGVPIYLHTMITCSAVFLLKVQHKWKGYKLGTDPKLIRDLVNRIIHLLSDARAGERHLSVHIAAGLQKMLDRITSGEVDKQNLTVPATHLGHDPNQSAGQMWDQPSYGVPDNGILRMFDDSIPFYEGHFFPSNFLGLDAGAVPGHEYRPQG